MDRVGVNSSTIQSVGYDAATNTLEIEFTNGNIYQYFDVPQGIYEGLVGAGSVGSFFSQNVRGVYRYARA
jgi:KTSC domain